MDLKIILDASPEFRAAVDLLCSRLGGFTELLVTLTERLCRAPSLEIAAPGPASPQAEAAMVSPPHAVPAGGSRAILDVSSQTAPAAVSKEPPRAAFQAKGGSVAKAASVWTPARDALLRDLYPTQINRNEIFARMQALPGPPIASLNAMAVHVSSLGLRRAPVAAPVLKAASASSPPEPLAVIPANGEQIARWGVSRGIDYRNSADLPKVNSKRTQLGLPPFALSPSNGRLTGIKL